MNDRLVECPLGERLVAGELQVSRGLFVVVGLEPVMGDQAVDALRAVGVVRLVPLCSTAMQAGAFRSNQSVVGRLLDEGVLETVDRLRPARFLAKKIQAQQMMNGLTDRRETEARHRLD